VGPPAGGGTDIGLGEVIVPEPQPPQVIGATQDVSLATSDAVEVALAQPVDLGLGAGAEAAPVAGNRVFLRIEGITGTAAAPVYDIYLNVPPGEAPTEHPELRAGSLSTFGMIEASESSELHDGSGLTAVFDVTRVRDALEEQGRWDPSRLQVSFSPVAPLPTEGQAALEEVEQARPADVQASRVAVMVT
jgi:tyrosinase